MISIQLADKLYKQYGIISICSNGKFVKFDKEIDLPAGTGEAQDKNNC